MSAPVPAIDAIGTVNQPAIAPAAAATGAEPTTRFADWFNDQVSQLNTQLIGAEQGVRELASGQAASLHDVMIRMEEARMSFQLAVQFRARVLEAYQDVMRMQV